VNNWVASNFKRNGAYLNSWQELCTFGITIGGFRNESHNGRKKIIIELESSFYASIGAFIPEATIAMQ
jgi:hypothetical protein